MAYAFTLCPTVAGGDSGELITVAATLGIAHPPGYPLYTLLGYLFSLVPIESVAWRLNFFSALMSSFAVVFLYLSLQRVTKNIFASATAALLYGFSFLVWRYSVIAEVFALNNFFSALLIYLYIRNFEKPSAPAKAIFYFVAGLALAHHQTIVFLVIPLIVSLERKNQDKLRSLIGKCAWGAVGFTPLFYLYFRGQQYPEVVFGDPSDMTGLLRHFLRLDYGSFALSSAAGALTSIEDKFFSLFLFSKSMLFALGGLGTLPLIAGFRSLPSAKWLLRPILVSLVVYTLVFHMLANLPLINPGVPREIISRFWLMPTLLIFVFVGFGLNELSRYRITRPLAILLLLLQFGYNVIRENQQSNVHFRDYAHYLMDSLPAGSVLFTAGDLDTNTAEYIHFAEHAQPTVELINRVSLNYPWSKGWRQGNHSKLHWPSDLCKAPPPSGYNLDSLVRANRNSLFYFTEIAEEERGGLGYLLLPYGLSFVAVDPRAHFDIEHYIKQSESLLGDPTVIFKDQPDPDSWEALIFEKYWKAHQARARALFEWSDFAKDPSLMLRTAAIADQLVQKRQLPMDMLNLATCYQWLQDFVPADRAKYQARTIEVWRKYLQVETRHDQRYMAIAEAVARVGNQRPSQ